jgi:tetratricopeptide (TPR) repeat protein
VTEILPKEVLDEVRQTARPERFSQASRALAAAVAALAEEEGELAVEAGRAAKEMAPRSPSAREALGLALYQTGAFREARTELAAAQRMLGDNGTDLAAVLADIERALGRPERALEIFEHTDRERLGTDAAAELLLVAASAYGDLGKPASGAALIRRHGTWPEQLEDHHLRLSYAQAKLAQEAGDTSTARRALNRVLSADPDFFDAADRLDALDNPDRATPATSDEDPDEPERTPEPDDTIDAELLDAVADDAGETPGESGPADAEAPGDGDAAIASLDEAADRVDDAAVAPDEAPAEEAPAAAPADDETVAGIADAAPELPPGDEAGDEPGDEPVVIELDEGAADRA